MSSGVALGLFLAVLARPGDILVQSAASSQPASHARMHARTQQPASQPATHARTHARTQPSDSRARGQIACVRNPIRARMPWRSRARARGGCAVRAHARVMGRRRKRVSAIPDPRPSANTRLPHPIIKIGSQTSRSPIGPNNT